MAVIVLPHVQGMTLGVAGGNVLPGRSLFVEFEPGVVKQSEVVTTDPVQLYHTYAVEGPHEIYAWLDNETRPDTPTDTVFVPSYTYVTYVTDPDSAVPGNATRLKCLETKGPHAGMERIAQFETTYLPLIDYSDDPMI